MKLYQDRRAPNARRVRIFLAEKGLDAAGLARHGLALEYVDLDITRLEHQADWFVAKQPLAAVPVLELDDGSVLCESVAICRWFDELEALPALFGGDRWARARVEQWNRHAELELLVPILLSIRHSHAAWADRVEQVAPFGAQARQQALDRIAWLDRELAGREFVAGPAFSIADITTLCALDFAKLANIRIDGSRPHLSRWYQAVNARPSSRA